MTHQLDNRSPIGAPRVVLYTRRDCCLCDEARRVLESHGLEPICIDVDEVAELRERHGDWVPVVEFDGQIRFRGRVDPVLLRRLLAGGKPD
jgi:glutaredoxin